MNNYGIGDYLNLWLQRFDNVEVKNEINSDYLNNELLNDSKKNLSNDDQKIKNLIIGYNTNELKYAKIKNGLQIWRTLGPANKSVAHFFNPNFIKYDRGKDLRSFELDIYKLLCLPITFKIRQLLVSILSLMASHPYTDKNYQIGISDVGKKILDNFFIFNLNNKKGTTTNYEIEKTENYEFRLMVRYFLETYCRKMNCWEIRLSITHVNDFLTLFRVVYSDFIQEMQQYMILGVDYQKIYNQKLNNTLILLDFLMQTFVWLCMPSNFLFLLNNTDMFKTIDLVCTLTSQFWIRCNYVHNISKDTFSFFAKRVFISLSTSTLIFHRDYIRLLKSKIAFNHIKLWNVIMNRMHEIESVPEPGDNRRISATIRSTDVTDDNFEGTNNEDGNNILSDISDIYQLSEYKELLIVDEVVIKEILANERNFKENNTSKTMLLYVLNMKNGTIEKILDEYKMSKANIYNLRISIYGKYYWQVNLFSPTVV
ncbi:Hypothetical protein SRAE_X000011900 [Strongyloides ratti]|uniref:Uncharacterized protein n=1 Tax=Strongyloides ratti TaxID=34506 RepID=A0A090N0J3_STRRB|nr:Hypothetical protein SRAE_X000011900 [Strongyloides ratti]CEF70788.2 Hypothetical protein SRAE_X000011900 [Strongyloides ratti]